MFFNKQITIFKKIVKTKLRTKKVTKQQNEKVGLQQSNLISE